MMALWWRLLKRRRGVGGAGVGGGSGGPGAGDDVRERQGVCARGGGPGRRAGPVGPGRAPRKNVWRPVRRLLLLL